MKLLSDLAADWPQLNRLLDEALSLPPAQRGHWLQSLPAEDAVLRDTLARLLQANEGMETGDFLGTLPRLEGKALRADAEPMGSPRAGDEVGPYRLIRELGEGGMGWVWLAERSDGALKRQVALKLPRLAWARGRVERMARERDILASLEHPHIARLYDAGLDQQGRPYLALEYVEGQPIDVHARAHGLGVKDRVRLLLQVAEAVAFAHGRLVVHRDLKPSNILVTAQGQVRLLDFGIAKLIGDDGPDDTALTRLAGRALTPGYASPEQIRGEAIGTASDVYSLGVVAYELLSGGSPYKTRRGSAAELEELIAAADPPLASEVAVDAALRKALRGDLDAILNKALKKDLRERYSSVEALALDFSKHLNHEPVSAQPDSLSYRAGKLLRRYRGEVAAAGLGFVAIGAAAALALNQARLADEQRDRAVAAAARADDEARRAASAAREAQSERERADLAATEARSSADESRVSAEREKQAAAAAEQQAQRATAVRDFLLGIFMQNSARQPDPLKAQAVTARELLDIGAQRLDGDLRGQPVSQWEMARNLRGLYSELGLTTQAVAMGRRTVALAAQAHGVHSEEHLEALVELAASLNQVGLTPERLTVLEQARAVAARLPERPSVPFLLLYRELTQTYQSTDLARSETYARKGIALARRGADATKLAQVLAVAGRTASMSGDTVLAEQRLLEATQVGERAEGADSWDMIRIRTVLAETQSGLLKLDSAEASFRRALADATRRFGEDALDTVQVRLRLGGFLAANGRLRDGLAELDAALQSLLRFAPNDAFTRSLIQGRRGPALLVIGRPAESEQALRELIALRAKEARPTEVTAAAKADLASTLGSLGRPEEARRLLDEAAAVRQRNGAQPGQAAWDRHQFEEIQWAQDTGDAAAVDRLLAQLVAGTAADTGRSRNWLQGRLLRAEVAIDRGRLASAAEELQQVARFLRERGLVGRLPLIEARLALGCAVLARAHGAGDSEPRFERAGQLLRSQLDDSAPLMRRWRGLREAPALAAPDRPAVCMA